MELAFIVVIVLLEQISSSTTKALVSNSENVGVAINPKEID